MTTFTWTPEFGSSGQATPNVTVNKFGDSYEQRVAQGMNSVKESWSLTFAQRESAEFTAIAAFLVARGGVEAFNWTTPEGNAIVAVCRAWNKLPQKGSRWTVTATFEQVFES